MVLRITPDLWLDAGGVASTVSDTELGHCNFSGLIHRHFSAYCAGRPYLWGAHSVDTRLPHRPSVVCLLLRTLARLLSSARLPVFLVRPGQARSHLSCRTVSIPPLPLLGLPTFPHLARFAKSPSPSASPPPHDRPPSQIPDVAATISRLASACMAASDCSTR